ncbi:MAG: NADH-quinone oxidoreductase subunit NuoK [Dehalococcoidia bacterium]|jgi:NADH:ubiquinone oxidoreductase subunit K|nr:NADH-quinone oxidoreductase subunit NuoK [Dehalococcoidia bacterium]
MTPLEFLLLLSGGLFSLGLYGVLARKNAVLVLMAIELMLNAVNVNLVAFVRYVVGGDPVGQVLVVFVITIAAAEVGLALAIILRLYRNWNTVNLDRISTLQQ